jgi:hypothetical protein
LRTLWDYFDPKLTEFVQQREGRVLPLRQAFAECSSALWCDLSRVRTALVTHARTVLVNDDAGGVFISFAMPSEEVDGHVERVVRWLHDTRRTRWQPWDSDHHLHIVEASSKALFDRACAQSEHELGTGADQVERRELARALFTQASTALDERVLNF